MSASGIGPKAKCNGGIHATNCKEVCCKLESWTNNTYKDVKGEMSLQRLNESRIEGLFAAVFSGALQTMAYDAGVKPPSQASMNSYNQAFTDFFRIMSPKRWVARRGPRKSCDGGGYYDVWRTKPGKSTWTTQRVTTLEKLAGDLGVQGRAKAIGKMGVPYNQFLPAPHVQKMDQLINLTMTVPTADMGSRVGMRPTLAAIFRAENGVLKPYGWFDRFLSALRPARFDLSRRASSSLLKFAPSQVRLSDKFSDKFRDKFAPKQPSPPPPQRQRTQQQQQPPPITPQEPEGIPTLALVAGGLVLVGGVAFVATRKN